jgi:hypothetical protein
MNPTSLLTFISTQQRDTINTMSSTFKLQGKKNNVLSMSSRGPGKKKTNAAEPGMTLTSIDKIGGDNFRCL